MFNRLKSEERNQRRNVRLDRKYLEARSRRFLNLYLNANEGRKPQFYEVLRKASEQCLPAQSASTSTDLEDSEIAKATSNTAMKIVLERTALTKGDRAADFETDAYATICIAYRRAAGGYLSDDDMKALGTAAVHLLTIAASFANARSD
jgi:hypothetical protein